MRFTGCSLSETEHSYLLPATHHLSDELCGFRLPTHGQQGQAKVKHHKLLHGGEVLLTEPGVLHQHQRLEAAAALQHRMGMAHVSAGIRKNNGENNNGLCSQLTFRWRANFLLKLLPAMTSHSDT